MSNDSRRHRGMRTQTVVAGYLRTRGWPYAESTGASRQGADITGTPDIAIEVKARRAFNPLAWIKQSVAAADGRLPIVIIRCDGQGETTIDEWPVMMRLADAVDLLHAAGYGAPDTNIPGGIA